MTTRYLSVQIGLVGALLVVATPFLSAEETSPAPPSAAVAEAVPVAITLPADHEIFVQAIGERRLLQFSYAGHVRVCEPHAYGVSSTGEAILHVYQTAGSSGSRPPPGWRTFTVNGITELVLTQRRFDKARTDYTVERPVLEPTWAELPAPAPEEAEAVDGVTTTRTITTRDTVKD